jgi:uncharacterized protein
MPESALFAAAVGLIFLVAGGIKGAVGVGLPTVAMGLLSLVMLPAQAAALIVIPGVATNIWQMLAGPALAALLKRYATLIAGIVAGTFTTIGLLTASSALATGALGAVLAAYGLYSLAATRFQVRRESERWLSPLIGLLTGMLSGATGVFVIPSLPYLSSLKLSDEELLQSIGITAFAAPLTLGLALAVRGSYALDVAGASSLAVLPALAGMYLGQRVRRCLEPTVFRRWFFAALVVLGGYMVLRSAKIV